VLGGQDDIELAVQFDDVALAQAGGDDFHGRSSPGIAWGIPCGSAAAWLSRAGPGAPRLAHPKRNIQTKADAMTRAPLPGPAPSPWWSPDRHADRRPLLLARSRIQAAIRGWLAEEGFVAVDPSALAISPGTEVHLDAYATQAIGNDGTARRMYLHTSPEFAMKKLLAAGETRIAAFAHVWRNRERGVLHSPEFTMLEWYRAGEDYSVLIEDCAALLALAARSAGTEVLRFRGRTCDPFAPPERLSVAEAFARHAGIDLMATIGPRGETDAAALGATLDAAGVRRAPDDTWSDMLA